MRSGFSLIFATIVLTCFANSALGAEISQISWSVTGGSFGVNGNPQGPITGGSVTYVPAGGVVSTSVSSQVFSGRIAIALSGPSGFFTISFGAGFTALLYSNFVSINQFAEEFPVRVASGPYRIRPVSRSTKVLSRFKMLSCISGGLYTCSGQIVIGVPIFNVIAHDFILGNEVRTIPEPAYGRLLGFGLLGLGSLAGGRHTFARRRRTQQG